jgi:hypothetical protein
LEDDRNEWNTRKISHNLLNAWGIAIMATCVNNLACVMGDASWLVLSKIGLRPGGCVARTFGCRIRLGR